jgi:deoxyribonuclease V
VKTLAALDVNYGREGDPVLAAGVLVEVATLKVLKESLVRQPAGGLFPYVPGLLSFREIPPLLKVLAKLPSADALLVNGAGLAHPRHFGLACHLGLLMDRPSLGCADAWLVVFADEPPPGLAGAYTFLRDGDMPVGTALRTQVGSRPVFVSPGHRMGVAQSADVVMSCVRGARLPEPLRLAARLSKKA